jgi:hypothetical protein
MVELADGMFKLGGLRKRLTSPDARSLRYKLLHPFKKALGSTSEAPALDQLIESMPGGGLRLNLSGRAQVVLATSGGAGSD